LLDACPLQALVSSLLEAAAMKRLLILGLVVSWLAIVGAYVVVRDVLRWI
jgi:hypothetical protein